MFNMTVEEVLKAIEEKGIELAGFEVRQIKRAGRNKEQLQKWAEEYGVYADEDEYSLSCKEYFAKKAELDEVRSKLNILAEINETSDIMSAVSGGAYEGDASDKIAELSAKEAELVSFLSENWELTGSFATYDLFQKWLNN